uniref:Uncharacterized protein n=1 Tax=Rhizophora mucronata TaxID=61149 RepID=A0A2P2NL05_RHIMU
MWKTGNWWGDMGLLGPNGLSNINLILPKMFDNEILVPTLKVQQSMV